MSGGGGTSHWEPKPEFDCARLIERTLINSPVPEVVQRLDGGALLRVTLSNLNGAQVLQAVAENGDVAGSLTPPSLPQIIECIGKGHSYVAIVLDRDGGNIRVEIRAEARR